MELSWHQARAAGLHALPYDIMGYAYRTDLYCPGCIVDQLPTGPGEAFDGWALVPPATMSTEANLDEIAAAFGIDRYDERTYDSGDFPKVVFRDQLENDERCGNCGGELES
jgi:hypothetical protein